MRVQWQEYLSIGVLEIDTQHKILFEKFNAFLAACEGEIVPDEVNRLFWFLEGYSVTHFNDEERLMQRLGFPDLVTHRVQHRAFSTEVGKLKERLRIEGATPGLIATATQFITGWLNRHITTMDRTIGQFAKTRPNSTF